MCDSQQYQQRIPETVQGIQVNFCKLPACRNFGVPASTEKQPRGPGAGERDRDSYTVHGKKKDAPRLTCEYCNELFTMKSNLAIQEEYARFLTYLSHKALSCPNESCPNHRTDIARNDAKSNARHYHSYGKTRAGSQRYRCNACSRIFSIGAPTNRQKKPHKNILVFSLLMNKTPFRRICEVAEIQPPALYNKIDFLHRQCLSFAGCRERKLCDCLSIKRLYIGVDRQEHMVNWNNANDKRNIRLHAVGSADNTTGYVFGLHLNFDPSLNPVDIEEDAEIIGDYSVSAAFRQYARVWLSEDYLNALNNQSSGGFSSRGSLLSGIENTYEEALNRDDIEVFESKDEDVKLPSRGMQVHAEYTLYGHFFFLRKLLGGVEKIRFFLDQDSGMRAACLGAFADKIKDGGCDAFYVRINKDTTINEKRQLLAKRRTAFNESRKQYPDMSDSAVKLMLIKNRMKEMLSIGKWQDRWLYHPFPSMSEPEKAVCYLTDTGKYDDDHLAWLYNKASLRAIDRFFMQIRRRISLLERPIATSSSAGRRWYGYSAYNPAMIVKLLDIFRCFYNYVEVGKDGKTPAMRLGLAKGRVDVEDIVYYTPY